jgi:hypothetical protein
VKNMGLIQLPNLYGMVKTLAIISSSQVEAIYG